MIASSKNISDYIDKQEYRNSVKDDLKNTIDEINALKKSLDEQKKSVSIVLEEQKAQKADIEAQIAQFLVRNEGPAAYVTELKSCIEMQKRALEAQRQNFEAQRQELEAQYEHIIASMSQEMCQLQRRNEELSMENVDLLKSFQSLHDPRSWTRSKTIWCC